MVTIDGVDYLSAAEACALLAIRPATLYAYVSRGRLRSYRQGMRRQRLYRREEVEALVALNPSHSVELPDAEPWAEIH
jgi:excisionase family DNA binding protein